ncbi:MAG: hypothetical protein WDN04_05150 [Rhodospirillales bacterium]
MVPSSTRASLKAGLLPVRESAPLRPAKPVLGGSHAVNDVLVMPDWAPCWLTSAAM